MLSCAEALPCRRASKRSPSARCCRSSTRTRHPSSDRRCPGDRSCARRRSPAAQPCACASGISLVVSACASSPPDWPRSYWLDPGPWPRSLRHGSARGPADRESRSSRLRCRRTYVPSSEKSAVFCEIGMQLTVTERIPRGANVYGKVMICPRNGSLTAQASSRLTTASSCWLPLDGPSGTRKSGNPPSAGCSIRYVRWSSGNVGRSAEDEREALAAAGQPYCFDELERHRVGRPGGGSRTRCPRAARRSRAGR